MAMRPLNAALLALFAVGATPVLADSQCPNRQREPRVAAIQASASCKAADSLDKHCWTGSMADLSPARAVVVKCEKAFLPGASKRIRVRYESGRQACLKRFEGKRGSGAASARMHCLVAAAVKYARH
jgi:hypothetical protein